MEAPISKPARQKSFSRRVSFNEDTILPPKERRREYSASDIEKRTSVNHPCCRICGRIGTSCQLCNFSFGLFFLFLIIVFFASMIYGLFFLWEMPKVRIQRIDVASENSTAAAADLTVLLNATNGDKRTQLIYSKLIASVEASGVRFGVARLSEFRQPPRNSTVLEVAVVMEDAATAARDLWSKSEAHALVLDVYVKGRIDAIHRGKKMHGFPFQIECRNIKQSEIDAGRSLPCKNELFESRLENQKSRAPGFDCLVGTQVDPSCN